MRLTAVLLLFVGIEGLKVGGAPSGIGRRAALIGASTSLTGLAGVVSLPRAAHADAIADIAARSNTIAQQEAVAKAKVCVLLGRKSTGSHELALLQSLL